MQIELPEAQTLLLNPFVVGRPLTGPTASLYVGREDVFAWLAENFTGHARPNALCLYGRRRIGKTSTLYQLVEGERGRPLRESDGGRLLPLYVDLQRLAGRPAAEWLRNLATQISRRTGLAGPRFEEHAAAGETPYATFDRYLDEVEEQLGPERLLLLAVDEFEQIKAGIDGGTLDPQLLPFLRSQIQHRERLAFLVCGSAALLDPYWSAIIDLTARCEVGPLTEEQTEDLVRRPLAGALEVDDAAVSAIWRYTEGHPYLVQSICHRLVSHSNRRPTRDAIEPADVEDVVERMENETYSGDVAFTGRRSPDANGEETPL